MVFESIVKIYPQTPHHILKPLLAFDAVSERPNIKIELTPAFETALGHARARAHPTPAP